MKLKNFGLAVIAKQKLWTLSVYLSSAIIPALLSLVINPFLAANLSPEDYAIIGYFTSFGILLLPMVSLSLLSYYSRNYFLKNEQDRLLMMNTVVFTMLIFGGIIFILFLLGFYFYFKFAHVTFAYFPYAIISLLPTFFAIFFSLYLNDKKMEGSSMAYLRATIANSVLVSVISILLVVIFKFGALGRLNAILIVSFVFFIFSLSKLLKGLKFSKEIFVDAMKFCWPLTLSSILYFFLSGVDKVFLERLNDKTSFGNYNVAFQISAYTGLIGTALITTFDPDIYKAIAEKSVPKLFRIVLLVIVPCIFVNIIFVLLAKPVISLLTYGRYLDATNYARILALRNITTPFYFVVSDIIIGYGFPKIELMNRIVGAFLSVLLFNFLIHKFGFFGASWGQVLTMLMMSIISLTFIFIKGRKALIGLIKS